MSFRSPIIRSSFLRLLLFENRRRQPFEKNKLFHLILRRFVSQGSEDKHPSAHMKTHQYKPLHHFILQGFYLYLCMCICMCIGMYMCMYVCMYLCVHCECLYT